MLDAGLLSKDKKTGVSMLLLTHFWPEDDVSLPRQKKNEI